jgi:hypothetical protein
LIFWVYCLQIPNMILDQRLLGNFLVEEVSRGETPKAKADI